MDNENPVENNKPNKDLFDKLGTVSTILIAVFTAFTAYHTNNLTNKINSIKAVQEEGTAVSGLIKDLTTETKSTLKYDYAFLALERYLRNTDPDGVLKPQDKEMLVGFAQTLILERINNSNSDSINMINRILIPQRFLEKNDTTALKLTQLELLNRNNKIVLPTTRITKSDSLFKYAPISQSVDPNKEKSIAMVVKKVCYIQYANASKKKEVEVIQSLFKANDWVAPGIENVKGDYKNTIRYFHDEDESVARKTNQLLGNGFYVLRVRNFENKVPNNQIEIWINNN